MRHGGAHQPGRVVHQDLVCIDIMIVKIVDLRIDEVDARTADSQDSFIQFDPPVHMHSPGPPCHTPVSEHSI